MQRRILVGIPILAAALIFFGLWLANQLTVPAWKSELNRYIEFKASSSNSVMSLERILHAGLPWKFTAAMSGDTYGDCYNFSPSYCYNSNEYMPTPPVLFTPGCLWCALVRTSGRGAEISWQEPKSAVPLLFPPEDLWCALVKISDREADTSQVIYIAKHQDLYSAGWIVHESSHAIQNPQLLDDLLDIGCGHLLDTGP
jgi:hypothetical protein